ncbi:MAG: glycoside hydrolase domain-containing protein, partial [Bacteroidota bacterium]
SALFVMSAMGFYQVCPGQPIYAIGSPLFQKITIQLENGKHFVIRADNNSKTNRYVQSSELNGTAHTKSYLNHNDIMNGGELHFVMDSKPNTSWASAMNDAPHSVPMKPIVIVPYLRSSGRSFVDSMSIELACNTPGAKIFFTTNGEAPTTHSSKYSSEIIIKRPTTIKAIAVKEGLTSEIVVAEFVKRQRSGSITLNTRYSLQYTGGGDDALVDGLRGAEDFRLGAWQGYEQNDLDAVVDLGSKKEINEVALGCLQDNNAWIFFPTEIEFSFSADGKSFQKALKIANDVSPMDGTVQVKNFRTHVNGVRAQYVRVRAKNIGVCPAWHKGAGGKAWLFVDEIVVE